MADYTSWQETTVRRVYELKVPSDAIQLHRMTDAAWKACGEIRGREPFDDEIEVTADEDVIRLSFIVDESPRRPA